MRTFRLFGMTLLMVLCAVSFTACSDDEDETVIEQANLIGKWQSTWEKIHKVEDGKEVVTSDEAYTNALLEFKTDGTCIESRVEGGYTETSRWSLKDNKLTPLTVMAILMSLLSMNLQLLSWYLPLRTGTI